MSTLLMKPADFEPLSQSPNLLDSTGTSKHRPCVCPCLQLPFNGMSKESEITRRDRESHMNDVLN